MKRKKIFIAVAFGTTVRDVLRNKTFEVLKNKEDLDIVIFAQDIGNDLVLNFGGNNIFFEKLQAYQPSIWERVFSHFHRAVLRDKCKTIDLGNTAGDTKILDRFTPLARLVKKTLGYNKTNKLIFWLYRIFTSAKLYEEEFFKHKPDLVVVTRVLNFSADYPLMRRAMKENIPVICLVSSWDNLTSKGFFPFSIDSLVVWNHIMKDEAVDLFNFPRDKIFISGIPRYDTYFNNHCLNDRGTFIKKVGLDPDRKLIVYATGSRTTGRTRIDKVSPEPEIVKFIAEHINSFAQPSQLLVRLHPQADPEEYQSLLGCKNVKIHIPGKKSGFQDRLFSKEDDCELAETMKHADVVVNLASTITIDAAVFNTPIICVNFDFRGERPYLMSVKRLYEFDHYAKLKVTSGFVLANSKKHLLEQLEYAMKNPTYLKENREALVKQQCVFTDGKAGERVAMHILSVLNASS